jgi:hypothetical protein
MSGVGDNKTGESARYFSAPGVRRQGPRMTGQAKFGLLVRRNSLES